MKRKNLLFIIIVIILFVLPLSAEKIKKMKDPIDESYIIDHLQMETDKAPENYDSENNDGDIIIDDSFGKSGENENTLKADDKSGKILKKLKKDDPRWHIIKYRIKKNDSISSIAKKFKTDQQTIIELNNIRDPGKIAKNQIILVPSKNGVYYRIRKGDTLSGIAKKFDIAPEDISRGNNISRKEIVAGKKIFIPEGVEPEDAPDKIRKIDKNSSKVASSTKKKSKTIKRKNETKIAFAWPLSGPITSSFGYRKDPFTKTSKRFHCGIDIGAEIGTPVKAAGDGTVIFSDWNGSYGYMVVVSHKNNYITVYAHNSKILVEKGETVSRGQVIALSGNTGAVTGAHLHFEIRKGTVPLNPRRMLKK